MVPSASALAPPSRHRVLARGQFVRRVVASLFPLASPLTAFVAGFRAPCSRSVWRRFDVAGRLSPSAILLSCRSRLGCCGSSQGLSPLIEDASRFRSFCFLSLQRPAEFEYAVVLVVVRMVEAASGVAVCRRRLAETALAQLAVCRRSVASMSPPKSEPNRSGSVLFLKFLV